MRLMAAPRKMPSMAGFGLEVTGHADMPRGEAMRLGIVASRFNEDLRQAARGRARRGAEAQCAMHGGERAGALEIPLALQWMAQSGRYDALVAPAR